MENLYNLVQRIAQQKRTARREPPVAHFRELADLLPEPREAWEAVLFQLHDIGLVHVGPTLNGHYVRPAGLSLITDATERAELLKRGKSPVFKQNP